MLDDFSESQNLPRVIMTDRNLGRPLEAGVVVEEYVVGVGGDHGDDVVVVQEGRLAPDGHDIVVHPVGPGGDAGVQQGDYSPVARHHDAGRLLLVLHVLAKPEFPVVAFFSSLATARAW